MKTLGMLTLGAGPSDPVGYDMEIPNRVIRELSWEHYFNGQRYDLGPWVIMPNHVHVLLRPRAGHPLGDIVRSWKSYTAKQINRVIGSTGTLWERDDFDRYLRTGAHLRAAIAGELELRLQLAGARVEPGLELRRAGARVLGLHARTRWRSKVTRS